MIEVSWKYLLSAILLVFLAQGAEDALAGASDELLYFQSNRDAGKRNIWRIPADGSAPPEQVTTGVNDTNATVTRDGRFLAFKRKISPSLPNDCGAIFVKDLMTGQEYDITGPQTVPNANFAHLAPTWHPSGTRLAFAMRINAGSGSNICDAPGGNEKIGVVDVADLSNPGLVQQLTPGGGLSRAGPSWSPKPGGPDILHTFETSFGSTRIDKTTFPGGVESLVLSGSSLKRPVYSPDGTKFSHYDVGDNRTIFVAEVLNAAATKIAVVSGFGEQSSWSPDGTKLAFSSLDSVANPGDIYIANADGSGSPTCILCSGFQDEEPWWTVQVGIGHFLLYDAKTTKNSPKFKKLKVALADQFDDLSPARDFRVEGVERLGTPADKDGGGIGDPDSHLVAYKIRQSKSRPKHLRLSGIKVSNQFGEIVLDTNKPDRLLVPSLKGLAGPIADGDLPDAFPLDHFKCYKVKITKRTPKFEKREVMVADQFAAPRPLKVEKPERLCNPVDKNGEGIINADGHLLCYKVKRPGHAPKFTKVKGIHVNNQFGPLRLDAKKPKELCLPSTKDLSAAVPRGDDDDDSDSDSDSDTDSD